MGILNGPRINFWGGIQTNVCTANNADDVGPLGVLDLATSTVTSPMTDSEIIDLMRTPQRPPYFVDGGWNYYGDHQVNFVDAKVSSEGSPGSVTEGGDLAGQPVYLLGSIDPVTKQGPFFGPVMVDLDPTASQSTQIFVGGLLIGKPDDPRLLIRCDTVCSSQSLAQRVLLGAEDSPGSSTFNGTFQLTFPKSSVVQYDKNSETIAAIMDDPKATGLVLRFSMFEMAPYLTTSELVDAYAKNTNPSNPSSGHVIGTLGPKYDGEPDTCPPGRLLVNTSGNQQLPAPVGYAVADDKMLCIDAVSLMLNAKFRADRKAFSAAIGPNIDYGPISVCVGTDADPIGTTFDAQPSSYYKFGGIVDVPLTAAQAWAVKTQPLALTGYAQSTMVVEQPLRIYSNARNIYIDDQPNQRVTFDCIVSYLGGPLNADTTFSITSSAPGTLPDPKFLNFHNKIDGMAGQATISLPVSDNGGPSFGFECLTITSGDPNDPNSPSYFVNFRKYKKTDFGIPAGTRLTWQQAYDNALRFYYVTFPAMSLRIPLNDVGAITATAVQILARLSPPYHNTTLRMPITRSMSPSQAKLLEDYLNNQPWQPLP